MLLIIGKIATLFRIRLKANAKLQTQGTTKVPILYGEKNKKLLDELETQKTIRQIGFTPSDKSILVLFFKIHSLLSLKETQLKSSWTLEISTLTLINLLNLGLLNL